MQDSIVKQAPSLFGFNPSDLSIGITKVIFHIFSINFHSLLKVESQKRYFSLVG
jgi:hypothetical protein